ncbi:MAG: DUF4262 domain-containing protein [Solirubrobacteraceae bacterium]
MSYDEVPRTRELLLTRIAIYGYAIAYRRRVGEARDQGYTYTVGLPQHIGHPELVLSGIGPLTAIEVIPAVVALLEQVPEIDGRVVGAMEDRKPLWIVTLPEDVVAARLRVAEWWRREQHDGRPATAKQIVCCDPAGRFPWESGCEVGYGSLQALLLPEIAVRPPILARPGDEHA